MEGDLEDDARALSATVRNGSKTNDSDGRQRKKGNKHQNKKNLKCFTCNVKGHLARNCPQKESNKSASRKGEDNVALVVSVTHGEIITKETKQLLAVSTEEIWLTVSGASEHITPRREWFAEYRSKRDGSTVTLGDNKRYEVVGIGTIHVERLVNNEWRDGRIENVLHVPGLKKNLLSNNNTYQMLMRVVCSTENKEVNVAESLQCVYERLGHLNARGLKQLLGKKLVLGVDLSDKKKFVCESCQIGKSHRLPFAPKKEKGITKPDVFERFKEYERAIANKFGQAIGTLHSDNGREYDNSNMLEYMKQKGISFETSAPHTPQQNGKAERSNRTVVECARTMLLSSGLPRSLWVEAVNCAVYLLNRVSRSSETSKTTAYEAWTGRRRDLEHVREFGASCFVNVPKVFTKKFDPKAKKVVLVGYHKDSKNYRKDSDSDDDLHLGTTGHNERDPESEGLDNDILDSYKSADDQSTEPKDCDAIKERDAASQGRYTLRDRQLLRPPQRYEANSAEINVPLTYEEATTGADAAQWLKAIKEELKAHKENGTWKYVLEEEIDMEIPQGVDINSSIETTLSEENHEELEACHNLQHWHAVKKILAYLVGTIHYGIKYFATEKGAHLIGSSDADYANDTETRRSVTGYIFTYSNAPVTWSSLRQKLVTLNSTEAEYVAATTAARDAVWLRRLLYDLKYPCNSSTPLFVDNQNTIKLS
uniref:Uncharacterized protein n=1 Tax=Trichogramma kaykai TaxID=54128 RepID=A0ABD2VV02_9HYME